MQNTLSEPRKLVSTPAPESRSADPAINKIEFRNGAFPFNEIVGYALGVFVCCAFAVSAIHQLTVGPRLPAYMVMGGLIVFACLAGICRLLQSALKRYRHFQEKSPKLTLTENSLQDHRTGTHINLADVAAFQFNRRQHKGNELMAELCLTLHDETVCKVDLRELHKPSKEIANAVKQLLNETEVEQLPPAANTAMVKVIAFVMVAGVILRIVLDVCQK